MAIRDDAAAMSAFATDMQAQAADLARDPPFAAEAAPQLKSFPASEPDSKGSPVNSSSVPALGRSEQDRMIASIEAGDHEIERIIRAQGKYDEADQMKASRTTRFAQQRASVGYVAPPAPSADEVAAQEHGVRLNAQPSDFRADPWSQHAPSEDTQVNLGELLAGLRLDVSNGKFLAQHIGEEGPRVKAMSEDQRSEYIYKNDKIFAEMVTRRGGDVAKVNATLKQMLQSHPLGQLIAEGALFSSPTLRMTLADHALAYLQFKNSRK